LPRAPENSGAPSRDISRPSPIVCYVTDSISLLDAAGDFALTQLINRRFPFEDPRSPHSSDSSSAPEGTGFSPSDQLALRTGALAPEALLLDRIGAAAEAGVDWIQLREKSWPGRALLHFALQVRARLAHLASPPKLIINDRLDVALTASADGIQLGSSSIPIEDAVRLLRDRNAPAHFLVCASCHSLDEARAAAQAGATHIYFGPVFDSPSKRQFGPPQGLTRLAEITSAIRIPVIAIGGITSANAHSCIEAGAQGVASIREFQDVQDESRAKSFVESVKR
jgi:thiamine-phosphate pyrophosphorylase